MEFTNYIDPKLLILVPVLYIIGMFIKNSFIIADKYIPLALSAVSVILAVLWLLATSDLTGWQSVLLAAFTAFVQGVLCAGAAVLTNQIIKQNGKDD